MAGKYKIVQGENEKVLRTVATEVKKFDGALKKLVKGMQKAMEEAKGIGIAAPQVGVSQRVFLAVTGCGTKNERIVPMVNPEIMWKGPETDIQEEGCLSLPGIYVNVERSLEVKVNFFDVEGNRQMLELSGLDARVVQHENDHLNGVLIVDRVAT